MLCTKSLQPLHHQRPVDGCDAAHGDHLSSGIEHLAQIVLTLDATSEIDYEGCLLSNTVQNIEVHHVLGTSTVEVHDM